MSKKQSVGPVGTMINKGFATGLSATAREFKPGTQNWAATPQPANPQALKPVQNSQSAANVNQPPPTTAQTVVKPATVEPKPPAPLDVAKFPAFAALVANVKEIDTALASVHETRRAPLTPRRVPISDAIAEIAQRKLLDIDKDRAALTQAVEAQAKLVAAFKVDIDAAAKKGPKIARVITCVVPAGVTTQTKLTVQSLKAATAPPAPLRLMLGKTEVSEVQFKQAGDQEFSIACKETEDHLETSTLFNVKVTLPTRQIFGPSVAAPVVYGTPITADSLGAGASGDGGPLTIIGGGILDVGNAHQIKITAPGEAGVWLDGTKTVTIAVTPAPRTLAIGKSQPAKFVTGMVLDPSKFQPKPSVGEGAVRIVSPVEGRLLTAGDAVPVTFEIEASGNYKSATLTSPVKVTKGKPSILWSDPPVLVKGDQLRNASLNAAIDPPTLAGSLVYDPPLDQVLDRAGTVFLKVDFPGDADFLEVHAEVRQIVLENANQKRGASDMQNGSAFYRPEADTPNGKALANYDALDEHGKESQIKTQAKQIFKAIGAMTGEQVEDYLDNLKPKPAKKSQKGGDEPIWKFPNGLQIRVKFEGDKFNFGAMLNMEVVTTESFSTKVEETAFKIMPNGEAGARGPDQNAYPENMFGARKEQYTKGTCRATHMQCRPKTPQVITWALPDGYAVARGAGIPAALLNVTYLGDSKITFNIGTQKNVSEAVFKEFNPRFPGPFTLSVQVEKTKIYTGAQVSRKINVS